MTPGSPWLRLAVVGAKDKAHRGADGARPRAANRCAVKNGLSDPARMREEQFLERSCRLHRMLRRRWGSPYLNDPRLTMVASCGGGSEGQGAPRGTAQRRQRSAAGGTAGSRSALIVPSKRGHGTRPDHAEGSEASDHGTVEGKYGECIEIRVPCQRNNSG